ERLDPAHAREVLDADHAGLEDVKDRITEYIAVRKLRKDREIEDERGSGAILTLIGPPGTGKTSIGESIARATGRAFVRMSLCGVRDEAEIRGHRRTHIGALPGRLLRALITEYTREAGVRSLERELGKALRKIATRLASGEATAPVEVDVPAIREALGRQRFFQEAAERTAVPGVATGLSVTNAGGDVLFIEATSMPGDDGLVLTGQLGDVMKESARIALSFV